MNACIATDLRVNTFCSAYNGVAEENAAQYYGTTDSRERGGW